MLPTLRSCRRLLPAIALGLTLSACANLPGMGNDDPPPPPTLNEVIEEAAAEMVEANPGLERYDPIIAASFADIDDLSRSSTLGRMATEIAASSLTQAGLDVREVRMRGSLFIQEQTGELMLSRQAQRLTANHGARAILVGTYAQSEQNLYMSMRLIRSSDAMVLSAASMRLPMNNDLRGMLGW
ncbi:FlgO family outer membrane protein [Halomonas sp. ND22Bw]|uniref:FlgO family outer membrane protein n=1 Tax=Halomonas sp. ND22Bw TaxID=2054178 RepID=UPI00268857AB